MTEVAVLLDAKSTTLSPLQRLVVPKTTRVETDVPADRPHVAQHRRRDRTRGFSKHWVLLFQQWRSLNFRECCRRSDLNAVAGNVPDPFQFRDMPYVHHVAWF